MRVFLNQFTVVDIYDENYKNGIAPFAHDQKYDLIVNPEVFTSGFDYANIYEISNQNRQSLASIQLICKTNKTAFCGSFLWQENSQYFNRAFFIDSWGAISTFYDKNHLIPAYQENEHLTAGNAHAHLKFNEFSLGLSICYDLRFPELYREYAKKETDTIIVMAQWPEKRLDHMITLAQARAIENQCYVIITNAVGLTGKVENAGHSMIIHPKGEILIDLEKSTSGKDYVIEHSEVTKWRDEFPSLYQYSRPARIQHELRANTTKGKHG